MNELYVLTAICSLPIAFHEIVYCIFDKKENGADVVFVFCFVSSSKIDNPLFHDRRL